MTTISTFFRLLLLISFVPALVPTSTVFDIELVHRDSPKSPLYNSSMTPFDRLQTATLRSVSRASYLAQRITMKTSNDIDVSVRYDDGEFLMEFSMGTPNPQHVWGILDTGSELNWVNCVGCQCFNKTITLFNHSASLSYEKLTCNSDGCKSFFQGHCDNDQMCEYHYSYVDGSYIDGMFSSDTFHFYSSATKQFTSIPNMLFGCNFRSLDTIGVDFGSTIGLGPSPPSLIHQLAPKFTSKYFSYCLDSWLYGGLASRLFLGRSNTTVAGKVTVTPFMTQDNFYAVQLNSISLPGVFDIKYLTRRSKLRAGNIIFDSGTAMTVLDNQVLDELVWELKNYVTLPIVEPERKFKLCFDVQSTEQEEELPGLLFSFAGELGNFTVSPKNLFTWFGPHVKCMVILGTNDIQVFGNIMQKDVLVGYDLEKMELTLTEKNCI
ncbi:probable aspartic protease At2g35615 [Zingiber officinale]|uniref:probable aspartic protease At2g35615 n=1 Tax=Zingiber officinale TaxID=94328 RepID=UPI001C4DCE26|nr:probable aspartic protease At2g35615 [Zingiber officinale]